MRDFDAIVAVNSGNPNSKFAKQVAAQRAKAAKPQPSEADVVRRAIRNYEKKVADRLKWAAECREDGQVREAERWERWVENDANPWLAEQRAKLAQMEED